MPDLNIETPAMRRLKRLAKERAQQPIVPPAHAGCDGTDGGSPVRANEQPYGIFAPPQAPARQSMTALGGDIAKGTGLIRDPYQFDTPQGPAIPRGSTVVNGRLTTVEADRAARPWAYSTRSPKPNAPRLDLPTPGPVRGKDSALYAPGTSGPGMNIARTGAALDELEKTVGSLMWGTLGAAVQKSSFQGEGQLINRFNEARARGVPLLESMEEAWAKTDMPSTTVRAAPARIPLPGGKSFQDVSVGVKGTLESILTPINALPMGAADIAAGGALELLARGGGPPAGRGPRRGAAGGRPRRAGGGAAWP